MSLINRLCTLFRRGELEKNLDDELRFHVEMKTKEFIEAGMPPTDARSAALRQFGNVMSTKEFTRSAWTFTQLEALAQDIRYGLRQLGRNPGFAAVAILTLGLGIGANTAIFSVVNGVLLEPLPFPQPAQLVALHASKPNFERGAISYPNFLDWQKQNHSFAAMAVCRSLSMSLTGAGEPERINTELIASDFFPLLGVKPLLGRTLAPGEDRIGAAPVALISEALWRRKFDASPAALGKMMTLDGKGYAIVGVIPASFQMGSLIPTILEREAYVPIGQWDNKVLMVRGAGLGIHGVGRLKSGVTLEQARADMAGVTADLARAYPEIDRGLGATLVPLKEQVVGNTRPLLLVLLAAVGFVLLIACVNVANLMLVRASSRTREFAIRAALGAGRWRVIRQLLVESVLLAAAGGGLGLLIATWGTRSALSLLPATLPRADTVGLDARVLIFTAIVSLLAGIMFGIVPSVKGSRQEIHDTLKESGRGASGVRHRAQRALVGLEVALALVLLAGAGLLIRSMAQLWKVDPGFNPHGALTFSYAFPSAMRTAAPETVRANCRELEAKIASLPRVQSAALTWAAFPMGGEDDLQFWLEGRPKPQSENEMNWALNYIVDGPYFQAMGIPLDRGRLFNENDNERAPLVVVVDDVFARKFFPGQDPIGKRIHSNDFDQVAEIVGVVGHVKQWGLDADDANPLRAQLYRPLMQSPGSAAALAVTGIGVVVRSSAEPRPLMESIRRATAELSGDRVIWGVQTLNDVISDSLASRRFAMLLLAAFAGLALLLACVGIYGVVSYLVDQRGHEIGVRMALGARQSQVLGSVIRDGARMTLTGLAAGVVASLGLTRLLDRYSLLFGVSTYDPLTFAGVAALLAVIALAACYLPARRATKIDPMVALRYE